MKKTLGITTSKLCCAEQLSNPVCDATTRPELSCRYETGTFRSSCEDGFYEEEKCTDKGNFYDYEFCCKIQVDSCSARDGCHYMDTWGDIASNSCPPQHEEIKACTVSHWFNNKEFCCPTADAVCNPAAKPALNCHYNTGVTSMACESDEYEEEACVSKKMCVLGVCPYEHEFCCKRDASACNAMDGCSYHDGTCPPKTEQIKACTIPHWFSDEVLCCPDEDSVCNPATKPELACYYDKSTLSTSCPAGYYEEEQCTAKKMVVAGIPLYRHRYCCKKPETCGEMDGCEYQKAFNSQCPKGTEEVTKCLEPGWFGDTEYCCPILDDVCSPTTKPELSCHYEQGALTTSCATGFKEEPDCTEKKACLLGVCACKVLMTSVSCWCAL